jgi:hypothetical protein
MPRPITLLTWQLRQAVNDNGNITHMRQYVPIADDPAADTRHWSGSTSPGHDEFEGGLLGRLMGR